FRYQGARARPDWQMMDRVTCEILLVDGKEDYRNLKVNGKALKKGSPEDSGSWSTGEFAQVLADIVSPSTAAAFKIARSSSIGGIETKVYDYSVQKPNSHW